VSDEPRVERARNSSEPFLSQLSTGQYRIAIGVLGFLLFLGLVRLRFCYTPSVPDKPRKPKVVVTRSDSIKTLREGKADPKVYLGQTRTDAQNAGVKQPTADDMTAVFKYTATRPNAQLSPTGRNSIESAGLRIEVTRRTHRRRSVLVLAIENPSKDRYMAYRVHTRPTRGGAAIRGEMKFCARRQAALIGHNAVAIRPNQTIARTECIYKRGMGLEILEIETMVIPPVSYFYVSKLLPTSIGVEARETAKHSLPEGAGKDFCKLISSSSIVRQIERKQITWRQLIDYFARHNCSVYRQFPEEYKPFKRNDARSLPVMP